MWGFLCYFWGHHSHSDSQTVRYTFSHTTQKQTLPQDLSGCSKFTQNYEREPNCTCLFPVKTSVGDLSWHWCLPCCPGGPGRPQRLPAAISRRSQVYCWRACNAGVSLTPSSPNRQLNTPVQGSMTRSLVTDVSIAVHCSWRPMVPSTH